MYAAAALRISETFENCIKFLDGTVLLICCPKGYALQRAVYNGHKRGHGLMFQNLFLPHGIAVHADEPNEGRRHDFRMWKRSDPDEQLSSMLLIGQTQHVAYGNSVYGQQSWFETSHSGSGLTL